MRKGRIGKPTFSDSIYDFVEAIFLSDIFRQVQIIIVKTLTALGDCARRCRLWKFKSNQISIHYDDRNPLPAWR